MLLMYRLSYLVLYWYLLFVCSLLFTKQTNEQSNKQANKQTSKQTNKQTSKQANKQIFPAANPNSK